MKSTEKDQLIPVESRVKLNAKEREIWLMYIRKGLYEKANQYKNFVLDKKQQ
jgi:hypothetical protein